MGIYNKRYEITKGSGPLLDQIDSFFAKLGRKKHAIRYAIVGVKKEKLTIEATILED
jgi:hypothetical protein